MFLDQSVIDFKSGDGGGGMKHFRRSRNNPKGGPDGGDGGRGGHIILITSENLHTLYDMNQKRKFKAQNGDRGGPNFVKGKDGSDIILEIPVGTLIKNAETLEVIADLDKPGMRYTLLKGGQGGIGNAQFKNSRIRAPETATPGGKGQHLLVQLELKLLADCGLVGYPNAGKSSLVRALSNATPKVGDFPFTTLKPSLGIVKVSPHESFVLADIPGIIEGAAEGRGLGNQFLRHIERSGCLAFVLDPSTKPLYQQYKELVTELRNYQPSLLSRPRLIVVNKMDLGEPEIEKELEREPYPLVKTSTLSQIGLSDFSRAAWELIKPKKEESAWSN